MDGLTFPHGADGRRATRTPASLAREPGRRTISADGGVFAHVTRGPDERMVASPADALDNPVDHVERQIELFDECRAGRI